MDTTCICEIDNQNPYFLKNTCEQCKVFPKPDLTVIARASPREAKIQMLGGPKHEETVSMEALCFPTFFNVWSIIQA